MLPLAFSVSTTSSVEGGGGGGGDEGGKGGEGGSKGGEGGEGEHAPKVAQFGSICAQRYALGAEPYASSKAVLPAHAQRMASMLSSDKASAFCPVTQGGA